MKTKILVCLLLIISTTAQAGGREIDNLSSETIQSYAQTEKIEAALLNQLLTQDGAMIEGDFPVILEITSTSAAATIQRQLEKKLTQFTDGLWTASLTGKEIYYLSAIREISRIYNNGELVKPDGGPSRSENFRLN